MTLELERVKHINISNVILKLFDTSKNLMQLDQNDYIYLFLKFEN